MKLRTLKRMNGGHLSQSISISLRVRENESETLFPNNKNEMKMLVFNFVAKNDLNNDSVTFFYPLVN